MAISFPDTLSDDIATLPLLDAVALEAALHDEAELALLDVRDHGVYARGHLLLATSAPYWRLELDIDRLVPRRGTRIVLVDDGGDLARDALRKLTLLGYANVAVLDGGISAWKDAGYQLFSGTNVLGKAFGEILEHELKTPHIEAADLRDRLRAGLPIVVVDSRTPEEFSDFSIPGAHSLPGAELVYRIGEVAPDPETLIVVNCAGRTRSIVGAQTLINSGIPNPVVSLEGGTMAWLMNGDTLEHGRIAAVPAPSAANLEAARHRAQAMASRAGVRTLDAEGLKLLERSSDARTLYRFDVRDREEYLAGHLPGWRWAPGGQLVQAVDEYAATRASNIVIADWDGVRALTTAAWLAQLGGFTVYTYAVPHSVLQETGPEHPRLLSAYAHTIPWVQLTQAQKALEEGGAVIFDIDNSISHAEKHIKGARFVAPGALIKRIAETPKNARVLLASSDGLLARSVAQELAERGLRTVEPILGGTQAWIRAGLDTESGRQSIETRDDDTWYGPYVYETLEERDNNFKRYLGWELGLVAQLDKEKHVGIDLKGSLRSH